MNPSEIIFALTIGSLLLGIVAMATAKD